MRKIIQISESHCETSDYRYNSLTALCDDGTVWNRGYTGDIKKEWEQLPDIPQKGFKCETFKDLVKTELSTRAINSLFTSGITGLSQLHGTKYDSLCKMRNIGRKTADEIERRMNIYGYKLER